MSEDLVTCVNHPDAPTRLSCSSCDAPICTRCMRQSAVGQKCPSCARPARRARGIGKPRHYVRAVAAGLAAGTTGGYALVLFSRFVGFGRVIVAALVGFLVGKAVGWGAAGQSQRPWPAVAATCAVVGILLGTVLATGRVPSGGFLLFVLAAAGWFAVRGLQR